MDRAITVYPETLAWLGEKVAALRVDAASLLRPLRRCDLSECRGTCCHDGVYLGPEEAEVLRTVVEQARPELEGLGLDLPETVVVYGSWRGTSGPKTAVRSEPRHGVIPGYPAHFAETSCVFLLGDARCALQVLAERRGLAPWIYKPLTCWMHPLSIEDIEADEPLLTLPDESTDPQRFPDYDGFACRTPCGATCEFGVPAWRVLGEELAFLGTLGGRDFMTEVAAHAEETGRQDLREIPLLPPTEGKVSASCETGPQPSPDPAGEG